MSKELVKCTGTRKDYHRLVIRGIDLGEFERSELREVMGKIDNSIGIGRL